MFQTMYAKEDQELIQKAISYLVENFNKSGNNSKPVILHSIRLAMRLYDKGEKSSVVIGALLHDLLEDTQVTLADITSSFGEEVAKLVEANSFKSEIADYVQKYIETFERNIAYGRDAAIIKAVDLLDNADYYTLGAPESWSKLYGKYVKFLEMAEGLLIDTGVWTELQEKKGQLEKQMGI